MDFIFKPIGELLYWLYLWLGDFGFAVIIFTIFIRLLLMPLNIKQIKSSMRMQELQPKIKALQAKYANNREALNAEMVKFFQENNYNPASGCIVMLVQLPILISLYSVITRPLSLILSIPNTPAEGDLVAKILSNMQLGSEGEVILGYTDAIGQNLLTIEGMTQGMIDKIALLHEKMEFLGIFNLAMIPKIGSILMWIPIVAAILTYFSTKMMIPAKKPGDTPRSGPPDQAEMMQKTMVWIAPIMTLFIGFQLQAALGLYWMTSSAFQVFQQLYINKNIKKPLDDANTAIILDANKKPVAEVNISPESKNNKQQGNKNGNNRKKK